VVVVVFVVEPDLKVVVEAVVEPDFLCFYIRKPFFVFF
jgi:hypothetical protein